MPTLPELKQRHLGSQSPGRLFIGLELVIFWSLFFLPSGALTQSVAIPRDQVTVPICSVEDVTDTVLFEDAADPTKKLYLSRYRIAEQNVSGQQQYQMSLQTSGQSWHLTLHLEKYPAPEIREAAREAEEINHEVAVILHYRFMIGNSGEGQKELGFQEVTTAGGRLRATLRVDSLSERDQLYQVITNPDYRAFLIVRRTMKVAIPVTSSLVVSAGTVTLGSKAAYGPDTCLQGYVWREAAPQDHVCVTPDIRAQAAADNRQANARRNPRGGPYGPDTCLQGYVWRDAFPNDHVCVTGETRSKAAADNRQANARIARGSWQFDFDSGQQTAGSGDVGWEQRTEIIQHMAPLGNAQIANLGMVDFDAVSTVQLHGLSYSRGPMDNAIAQLINGNVFAVLTNTGNYAKMQILHYAYNNNSYNLGLRWVTYPRNPLHAAGASHFQEVIRTLDNVLDPKPFVFSPNLHGYIFRDVTPAPGQGFDLIRRPVNWQGNFYNYYQDQAQSHLFYYLPDSFKLARRQESPHYPVMSVRFTTTDGTVENMQVALEYIALPFVDPNRLKAAAEALKHHVTEPLPLAAKGPVLAPLLANTLRFRVALPRADASSGPFQDRTNASIDLQSGIRDTLTLSMEDFQAIFDAMFGRSAVLFRGEVKLEDTLNEVIPFTARMNDLVGELVDFREVADEVSGGVKVTVRNVIESPVRINHLTAMLQRGEAMVPGEIRGLSTPVALGPGEEITLTVAPSAPIAEAGAPHAVFDLSGVEVLPDPEKVWNAILDPNLPAEYLRSITVKTFREMFNPSPDRPGNQIMAILVEFERGETVELNADRLEAKAALRLPLSDIILRRVDQEAEQGKYRYRVTVIRKEGRSRDEAWKTDRIGILFPEVN